MEKDDLKGLYIAHRGIQNGKMIENTIPAFSLALDDKIPIELDIHILKDGNLVVYHDKNLKRLMKIDRQIASYNYDELKQCTFPNTDIHIPLFSEVLNLVNGKVLLIVEIKKSDIFSYQEYCGKIKSILDNYPYFVVIKSFDIRIVRWFLKNTNYMIGLLISNRKKSCYDWLMRLNLTLSLLKPDFISVDYHIVSKKVFQKFRKHKPVLVWTISNLETLEKVRKDGDSYLIQECYF